ncbi:hypothetical protein U9M48_021888 [Paspalum notatum var. saurae]|uniref:Uncharacterized protein n=1 Tax=Paspalum notatum var. saurae TaxID=547442 RepID=A0AAQ3WTF8_PASNO
MGPSPARAAGPRRLGPCALGESPQPASAASVARAASGSRRSLLASASTMASGEVERLPVGGVDGSCCDLIRRLLLLLLLRLQAARGCCGSRRRAAAAAPGKRAAAAAAAAALGRRTRLQLQAGGSSPIFSFTPICRLSPRPGPHIHGPERSTSRTRWSKLRCDAPPGLAASIALSIHSLAFLLISFPCSPSMSSVMRPATASRRTLLSISMPTPHSLVWYRQLVCWSAKKGQLMTGTPLEMASSVEFQPLCVRKAPTAGWLSTSCCGHQLAMSPRPAVSARNSGGSTAVSPLTRSRRMIHRNCRPLLARPHANSTSCSLVITVMLPKLT